MQLNQVLYHVLKPAALVRADGQQSFDVVAMAGTQADALHAAFDLKLREFAVICAVCVFVNGSKKEPLQIQPTILTNKAEH